MSEKRNINIEKETKQAGKELSSASAKKQKENAADSKAKQYPRRVGFHGTDDEKELNPEE